MSEDALLLHLFNSIFLCVEFKIISTWVRLSPVGSSGAFVINVLEDSVIPPDLNSVLLMKVVSII